MRTSNFILSITGVLIIISVVYGSIKNSNNAKANIDNIDDSIFTEVSINNFDSIVIKGDIIVSICKGSNYKLLYYSKDNNFKPEFNIKSGTLNYTLKADNKQEDPVFIKIIIPKLSYVKAEGVKECLLCDFKQDTLFVLSKKSKLKIKELNCMYLNINTRDSSTLHIEESIIGNINITSKTSSYTKFSKCNIKKLNGVLTSNSIVKSDSKLFNIVAIIDSTSSLYKY
jgi:hypothetical protein